MILYDICLRNQSATTHSRSTRSTGNRKEATPLPKVDPPDESSRSSTEKPQLQRCFFFFYEMQSRRCRMPGTLSTSNIGRSKGLIVAFLLVCLLKKHVAKHEHSNYSYCIDVRSLDVR